MNIKAITKKNVYIQNKLSEIRNKRSNDIIRKRIKECSEIDSILNFDEFRDLIISWKKDPY